MSGHYNLYYLFLEDKRAHPLPEEKNRSIRENVIRFYKRIKPPWFMVQRKGDTPSDPAAGKNRGQ